MTASPPSGSGVLGRAVAASAALALGVATATGFFVAKIARSYAAPNGSTEFSNSPADDNGSFDGSGQLSPQLNQPPVGSSHGS